MSFLRLLDEDLPEEGKSRSPQKVFSLTIGTESPTLTRGEKHAVPAQVRQEASPTRKELCRFLERRREAELGHELPLYASEAADYLGVYRVALDQLVSKGEIPIHRDSYQGEELLFSASDLNEWLAKNADYATEDLPLAPHVIGGTEHELR
jgi:excisionase family DNA binding protein